MTPFEFIVVALAVHRVTHLVVEDSLPPVVKLRAWVGRKGDAVSYLVNCFWCSSVWVSAMAVGAMYAWTPAGWRGVSAPFMVGAALSSAATAFESILQWLDSASVSAGAES